MDMLPAPHRLDLGARRSKDLYRYFSPRNDRDVLCVGGSRWRLGIWLEFHPDIVRYSERPQFIPAGKAQPDFAALAKDGSLKIFHAE